MPQSIQELVAAASFIFEGTVEALGASTVPVIPAGDRLAVIAVHRGLRSGPAYGDLRGKRITLLMSDREELTVGSRALFFTNTWIVGGGIAVREVAHLDANADTERALIEELARLPDRHLARRLSGADLVVSGTVTQVRTPAGLRQLPTRHAPRWMAATLRIESASKGDPQGRDLTVLFPSSDDRLWHHAPRFHEGLTGVFVLHRGASREAPPEALTALDSADFQPREQLSRIEELLAIQQPDGGVR